jgi:two-component system nitrate/nitrite sensor histidine kinase NarX/two-component system sensor histidine kinase UhpB
MIAVKSIKSNIGIRDCSKCELPIQLLAEKKKLQSLAQNLFKIQEDERQQLSHELHDELGQWLTAIYADAVSISNRIPKNTDTLANAQSIKESVGNVHKLLHAFMYQLRPALLDTLGLEDSLKDLKINLCLHNPDISCRLELSGKLNKFDEILNITIYRIIQEALNNISKHAKATKVLIRLNHKHDASTRANILWLEVEDNGKGYNPIKLHNGFGILGMRERANSVNGEFSLYSQQGKGTQLKVRFPIKVACAT